MRKELGDDLTRKKGTERRKPGAVSFQMMIDFVEKY